MKIFGDPRKRSRGQRGRDAQRGRFAPRHERATPLDGLVDEQRHATGSGARKKGKREGPFASFTLGHVAFLVVGLALGASMLLVLNSLGSSRHAPKDEEEKKPATPQAAVAPTRVAAPRQLAQATTPVEAVRLMLKATIGGDKETAYAQWEIGPNDLATLKSGQAMTLAELTAATYEYRAQIHLADYEYTVKPQSGEEAKVVQTRDEVITQIFSLRRHGPYWKISYASSP